jgi:hypothetical protein
MKTYTIKKGKHRCCFFKLALHLFKRKISHYVYFDNTAEYNLESNDQYDINKLFGISYGFHHKNSARFGWRWDLKKEKIEILAYVYKNGKRVNEWDEDLHIGFVEPYHRHRYTITKKGGYYEFLVEDETLENIYTKKIKHGKCKFWGYLLFPYFGGNKKAPHDIMITII